MVSIQRINFLNYCHPGQSRRTSSPEDIPVEPFALGTLSVPGQAPFPGLVDTAVGQVLDLLANMSWTFEEMISYASRGS